MYVCSTFSYIFIQVIFPNIMTCLDRIFKEEQNYINFSNYSYLVRKKIEVYLRISMFYYTKLLADDYVWVSLGFGF